MPEPGVTKINAQQGGVDLGRTTRETLPAVRKITNGVELQKWNKGGFGINSERVTGVPIGITARVTRGRGFGEVHGRVFTVEPDTNEPTKDVRKIYLIDRASSVDPVRIRVATAGPDQQWLSEHFADPSTDLAPQPGHEALQFESVELADVGDADGSNVPERYRYNRGAEWNGVLGQILTDYQGTDMADRLTEAGSDDLVSFMKSLTAVRPGGDIRWNWEYPRH